MGTTATRLLRYPEGSVASNLLHTQIKNLADDLEAKLSDSGWQNLILGNGWTQYPGHAVARYRRFQGLVHITGLIQRAGAPATGSVIATLPANYRFLGGVRLYNPVGDVANSRIDMNASGQILWLQGGTSYLSLDCIVPYIAEA